MLLWLRGFETATTLQPARRERKANECRRLCGQVAVAPASPGRTDAGAAYGPVPGELSMPREPPSASMILLTYLSAKVSSPTTLETRSSLK